MVSRITRPGCECSPKPTLIDAIGRIGKMNPRLLCINPYLLRAAAVASSLIQTRLWRYTPRCNEAQNCVDRSAKPPCCRTRRRIERGIEPVMLVALSYSRNSISRNPSGANADLFLSLSLSISLSVLFLCSNHIFL